MQYVKRAMWHLLLCPKFSLSVLINLLPTASQTTRFLVKSFGNYHQIERGLSLKAILGPFAHFVICAFPFCREGKVWVSEVLSECVLSHGPIEQFCKAVTHIEMAKPSWGVWEQVLLEIDQGVLTSNQTFLLLDVYSLRLLLQRPPRDQLTPPSCPITALSYVCWCICSLFPRIPSSGPKSDTAPFFLQHLFLYFWFFGDYKDNRNALSVKYKWFHRTFLSANKLQAASAPYPWKDVAHNTLKIARSFFETDSILRKW